MLEWDGFSVQDQICPEEKKQQSRLCCKLRWKNLSQFSEGANHSLDFEVGASAGAVPIFRERKARFSPTTVDSDCCHQPLTPRASSGDYQPFCAILREIRRA